MRQPLASLLAIACIGQLGLTILHKAGYQIALAQTAPSQPRSEQGVESAKPQQLPQIIEAPSTDSSSRDRASIDRAAIVAPLDRDEIIRKAIPSEQSAGSSAPQERDPFVPYYSINRDRSFDDNTPLTQINISDLRLSAVIKDPKGSYAAAVQTQQGRSFILKRGARIGNRGGQVVEITASKVIISEIVQNSGGKKAVHFREIAMKTPPPIESMAR
jgi:Tfp pilus assembly protein PilP